MAATGRQCKPIEVFLSYSHRDEDLRNELEKHLSILSHQGMISTWHDRKIGAGDEWRDAIDEHLNSAQIILLLISADFLASKYCYDIEMESALNRHKSKEARVIPIILRPVDWKGAPFGELQALPTNAEPVMSRRWGSIDEAFVDVAKGIRKEIEKMDREIPNPLPGPKALVVDQWYRGNHPTIGEAIAAAPPGAKILVKPGVYDEGLVLDKPLEIVGDGDPSEVIVRAVGKNAVFFKTTRGRISNLTLKQNGDEWFCVDIAQGCLELEDCDITSGSLSCVAIRGNAYPKIRRNKIHDGKQNGVLVYESGQGIIEDNYIFGNAFSGIEIREDGNPAIRRNKIHDGKQGGVFVQKNGQGIIEDNDIFGNAFSGIEIREDSNPAIRRNKIYNNRQVGVYVSQNGKGSIEDNNIFGNARAGIEIREDGDPIVRRNQINKNGYQAVWIYDKGAGIIEDNDLRDNTKGPLDISENSKNLVKIARNIEK